MLHDDRRPRLDRVIETYEKWLALTSPTPAYATLGTIAANRLPGDPVWLGLIGPPSSAKTELLNSTSRLSFVVSAGTLTPAGLLSGTPKPQLEKGTKGGLLRQIGEFGILTLRDFGSILTMRERLAHGYCLQLQGFLGFLARLAAGGLTGGY
jgi:hypothetical protein